MVGLQWYVLANLRLIGEYSYHEFDNPLSSPSKQKAEGNFVTLRAAVAY